MAVLVGSQLQNEYVKDQISNGQISVSENYRENSWN
jgi:hypothetical protein